LNFVTILTGAARASVKNRYTTTTAIMKPRTLLALAFLFCLFALSSCAPGGPTFHQYGFFHGLLHGFILIFAVIGKMFGGQHGIYAIHNTGFFYWFGFLLGLLVFTGGGAASARS
jgi:hypothetical protein